jgi:hypothetical protein
VDGKTNQVTVRTDDERTVTYDPRRLQGVTVHRETERAFATGDRVQMTAPDRERAIPNRELGTIERIDTHGRMGIRWDSGRTSSFDAGDRRHLDYGYAVSSHCSQGQTAGRVLVHVETASASEKLVNQGLAYVAVSRGQHDARIYTDDKVGLARAWVGRSRIDQRLRERPCNHRDKARIARSHGVNRLVILWPSVVHDDAVLGGVQGALRRLYRPGHRLRAAPGWLLPTAITRGHQSDLSNRFDSSPAHERNKSCGNMTFALRPHNESGSDVSIGTSGPRPRHWTS